MNPKIGAKLSKFLSGGSLFPCAIFYVVGLIWFLLLSQDECNNETYLSENALLAGMYCAAVVRRCFYFSLFNNHIGIS